MPVTYLWDRESGLIRTRCTGNVTFEEVTGHFRELESDPSLPARLDVLLDLSEMESLPESLQLKAVAKEVNRLQRKVEWGAWAIVASRDDLFDMTRVFKVFSEEYFARSRLFRELDEAERWLDSVRSTQRPE